MDQVKIGKFIQSLRKEKGLTQKELAEKLLISDKTVSKWETGNGLPEVAYMLPLCNLLGISVNELLSGEKLDQKNYSIKAEENIMKLMQEREQSKKSIIIAVVVALITLLGAFTIIMLSGFLEMPTYLRIILIVIAFIIIFAGLFVCCILENNAGAFECRHCGHRFVPSMKSYILAPHTITTRFLKCPNCHKRSWCKKRLTRNKEDAE